ncbi:response regulator transcription factor [Bradyrhizobium sp. AUGA SZCCT0240]|uniref:response regulator n=1 Tax=unclassified Bradyrhizobium TaxID=2631580 RepID=UPI001BA679B1|nr:MULTISPECIES: response regulator transcription factor [unclassified Bradyrhizobium]MBR1196242.1 response regulator transcription factor [Bradyrhizobium sp. AUGA SZCCT0158]MBR1243210.1 response regulator transcription factor [Bradyrhizobium sp. AUGA SZCCT0274]MBR1257459.1 response regulator transcription factor [Bradyrhizobium sp. AUGA SZCCT0240]
MTRIRIALVDDHPVVLAGIRALLLDVPDVELVGEANTGAAGLKAICECSPDIAVIDLSLPDFSGMELARRLSKRCPAVKIIALTVHEDRAYVHPVLDAGARGYLLKRSAGDELLRAIRAVNEGSLYLDPAIAEKTSAKVPELASAGEDDGGELSPREEDVLKLVSQGFSNKQIGGQLEISVKSVETYKARASEKKGLHSRADIVRYGIKQGWLTTPN